MGDCVGSIFELVRIIGRPAQKYLNYHRKFDKYIQDFRQARADLLARKEYIQQQLQDEHHFGKRPNPEVEKWLERVDKKITGAQGVQDRVREGKYLFRSCLGKLVDEATQEIQEVHAEGHFFGNLVVNDPSTRKLTLPTEELLGADKVEEIYEYLIGDEVRKIGVCGMGGIGKTTIMKHVHNKLLKESKIDKLIWTTISHDFDVRRLQQQIASQLEETLSDHDDTTVRAAKLSAMLGQQGRHVLILDDVWTSFTLADVGILEPTTDNGCKFVLTTRSGEIVRSMGCKEVQVALLSTDLAWQLFLSKLGQDLLPYPIIKSTMKLVVEECDGLPLAIVTIAGCMRGKSDLFAWENTLRELRNYIRNIQDMEDKVFRCLKFSYDCLKQKDQDCFLYCALYPEDHEIPKEEIIEHWMEEGLIDEMGTRKAMHDSGHSILKKLEENYLLESILGGTHIKMHDVVRDMAMHITRKRFLVKAGKQLEELPKEEEWAEDLEKASLMYTGISSIPQNMKVPKFQKLTNLFLSKNRLKEIPESFFEHTPYLKILDLSGNPIVNLPNSTSNLEKLIALLLRGCDRLGNLPSLSKLQALKKLDLGNTSIYETPPGLEMLVNLRFLNLGITKNLREIPKGLLANLCYLQYLAIHPTPTRVEDIMEFNNLEIFEGCFSNVCDFNKFTGQRKKLHKYVIWVGSYLENNGNDLYIPFLNYSTMVCLFGSNVYSGEGIIVPYDVQQLKVKCIGMRSLDDIRGLENASGLKECAISDIFNLESLFSPKSSHLETLESLELEYLPCLKAIVGKSSAGTFSSIRQIRLWECNQIKNVLSAKCVLHNLEDIIVVSCYQMEEIIESKEDGTGTNYTLPKLRTLHLRNLPKLKTICSKNTVMVCDALQLIYIDGCPRLKRIPLYLPSVDQDKEKLSPPPSLKKIQVYSKEWWESVEWDHPDAENVLRPFLNFGSL